MTRTLTALATIVAAACALQVTPARASVGGNAVDFCQPSLSNLENGVRKRPLAIANEGTITTFVSCSVQQSQTGEQIDQVLVLFTNRSNTPKSVSCTLVDGVALPFPGQPPKYFAKTFVVAPANFIIGEWDKTDDNGGVPFGLANLSCALPPETELNTVSVPTSPPEP
jgi:hypothetical protein